jgi:hypothetical protein
LAVSNGWSTGCFTLGQLFFTVILCFLLLLLLIVILCVLLLLSGVIRCLLLLLSTIIFCLVRLLQSAIRCVLLLLTVTLCLSSAHGPVSHEGLQFQKYDSETAYYNSKNNFDSHEFDSKLEFY